MEKISNVLNIGRNILAKNNMDINEARLLLAYALRIEKERLVKIDTCTSEELGKFLVALERRVNGVPYAYIVGHKEFMGLDFEVNKDVLIPRNDTEILVEEVLKEKPKKILDMCTGSGCIAISIAKNINYCNVTAVDISSKALKVAKINALKNNVKVNFILSDLFKNISDKYDLIVSNPPYIRHEDMKELQTEVKNEPHIALDGGMSGIEFYEKIISKAPNYLNSEGKIFFEIGYDEAKEVSNLLEKDFKDIKVIKDLSGNARVVKATLK